MRIPSWLPRASVAAELAILLASAGLVIGGRGIPVVVILGIPVLLYGWLGARIATAAPTNNVGWLLATAALLGALAMAAAAYAQRAGAGPADAAARVFSVVIAPASIAVLFVLMLLSFPNGRLPSPHWRPVAWLAPLAGLLLGIASLGDTSLVSAGFGPTWLARQPFGRSLGDVAVIVGGLIFLLTVASLVVRSRAVTTEERRPIRGILFTLLTMTVALLIFVVVARGGDSSWIVAFFTLLVLMLGFLVVIPFSLSIAMLRYGLFDYEVGIRKTIARHVLTAATVLVVGALLFLLSSAILGGFVAGRAGRRLEPAVALATGIAGGVGLMLIVRWARGFADRVVFRGRETPYEVLSGFSAKVGETYSLDDVLPRMASIVATGTGASVARVFVDVDGELRPLAAFPDDPSASVLPAASVEDLAEGDAMHAFAVDHRGETLGALVVTMPANDPMNPQKRRLISDVAHQAGLVLRNVRLLEDVRRSRRRIVAAQDERARRLERNIHDGAQQQLVALTVKLRLAEQLADRDPAKVSDVLRDLRRDATDALEDLRDLARGIYPPLLADEGLAVALAAQARKAPVPVTVRSDGVSRYSQDVESAVYFSCLEGLQNVAKYAEATRAWVDLSVADGELRFEVGDDGVGFDPGSRHRGTGLQGVEDRIEALGGTLRVRSEPGAGTTVTGVVPIPDGGASPSDVRT